MFVEHDAVASAYFSGEGDYFATELACDGFGAGAAAQELDGWVLRLDRQNQHSALRKHRLAESEHSGKLFLH